MQNKEVLYIYKQPGVNSINNFHGCTLQSELLFFQSNAKLREFNKHRYKSSFRDSDL